MGRGFKSARQRRYVMAKLRGKLGFPGYPTKSSSASEERLREYVSHYEEALLAVMDVKRAPRSTRELAKEADMDWYTADKYLKRLKEKGYVEAEEGKGKTTWTIKE